MHTRHHTKSTLSYRSKRVLTLVAVLSVVAGKAEEEEAREFEMRELAAAQELAEANAQKETQAFLRSSERAKDEMAKVETAALTARRLQALSESLQEENLKIIESKGLAKLRSNIMAADHELIEKAQKHEEVESELKRAEVELARVKSESEKSEKTSHLGLLKMFLFFVCFVSFCLCLAIQKAFFRVRKEMFLRDI